MNPDICAQARQLLTELASHITPELRDATARATAHCEEHQDDPAYVNSRDGVYLDIATWHLNALIRNFDHANDDAAREAIA